MNPIEAGKWLARCLDPAHKQRLNYAQERLVYALACREGEHAGFRAYAASIGYQVQAIDVSAQVQALASPPQRPAKQSADLSAEAMPRMRAARLYVAGPGASPPAAPNPSPTPPAPAPKRIVSRRARVGQDV